MKTVFTSMAATLKSLAKELNLSHTTVAKVLNNDTTFRTTDETRQRIRHLAEQYGYRPSIAARHLLLRETRHIGLLLHNLYDPYFAALAHGVEKAVATAGYSLVLGFSPLSPDTANNTTVFDPTSWYVDGLIAGIYGYYPPGVFSQWNRKMPVVTLGNTDYVSREIENQELGKVPSVDFDQFAGSQAVGRHLVGQGCTRIAYLGWSDPRRVDGLRTGVLAAGGNAIEEMILDDEAKNIGLSDICLKAVHDAVEKRIASRQVFPDALFCYNDSVAGVAFGVLRRHGFRIPADVCLVGFNNDLDSPHREIPLTSVSVPIPDMCRVAVESIVSRLSGTVPEESPVYLAPELIIRESSRRLG